MYRYMFVVRRSSHNPLLSPQRQHSWEALAAFNWSPIIKDETLHCLYRAMSLPEPVHNKSEHISTSSIARCESDDGVHFKKRAPFITPSELWDRYGCEDPRVTYFEGTYYTFYTALSEFPFNKNGIKGAVALSDDLETIQEKHLVTPFNAKALALFPERINGKVTLILDVNPDDPPAKIAIAQFDEIEDLWNEEKWTTWRENLDAHIIDDPRDNENDHVEVGAVPIKTEHGWLLIYSHIKNYFSNNKHFGVRALLLDLNDPRKIICRTPSSFLSPEVNYEKYGHVPDIVFPSGALVYGDYLDIYYGAADTSCARASVHLENLLSALLEGHGGRKIQRFENNPILEPNPDNAWEKRLVFNPAAVDIDDTVNILYRAMGEDNTSVIGLARSNDAIHINERCTEPAYTPREPFEEKKKVGNSGCEDPRISRIGDTLYMTYTAYDGINVPSVAVSSISVTDFKNKNWGAWEKPYLISSPGIMDKDSCILPEPFDEGYLVLHRLETNICGDFVPSLDFKEHKLNTCIQIIQNRPGMWDGLKVGIAGPPLKTENGWLLFYHGVDDEKQYRVGAALLDLSHPTNVIARTSAPFLVPEEPYEKEGEVSNVIFPCGNIERDGMIYLYYGGADKVVAGAYVKKEDILKMFL